MKLDAVLTIYTDIEQDHKAFVINLTIPQGRGHEFKERFKDLAKEFDSQATIDLSHWLKPPEAGKGGKNTF